MSPVQYLRQHVSIDQKLTSPNWDVAGVPERSCLKLRLPHIRGSRIVLSSPVKRVIMLSEYSTLQNRPHPFAQATFLQNPCWARIPLANLSQS
jgi:hypothetical protein